MTEAPILTPHRTALLLMDLQEGIFALLPDPSEVVQRAQQVHRAATDAGMHVVFVRTAFTERDFKEISPNNKTFAPVAAGRLFAEGSPETEFSVAVRPGPKDKVFTKTRTGAFSTTGLEGFLRKHNIDTLVLAGIATSGVVLSTIRDAADSDYRLLVLSDVCADPDADLHRTLITTVFPAQADLVDARAFTDVLAAGAAEGAGSAG